MKRPPRILGFAVIIALFGLGTGSLVAPSNAAAAKAETVKILLGEETLEAKIDGPRGKGPYPMLVIAPSTDLRSRAPLLEKLTFAASRLGFIVVRFDWLYTKKKDASAPSAPSAEMKSEIEELGLVINELLVSRMMKQYEIDAEKIALLSVGFGSRVAMAPNSGGTGPKVKASILLAPTCTPESPFKKAYAPWVAHAVPRLLFAASQGTDCDLAQIYEAAPGFGSTVSLYTPKELTPDTVVKPTTEWLKNLGWTPKPASAKKKKKLKASPADHKHEGHSQGAHPH